MKCVNCSALYGYFLSKFAVHQQHVVEVACK